MPKFLSQNQVNDFLEAGFLAPIDVMSEDQALSYRQRLEAAESEYPQELNAKTYRLRTSGLYATPSSTGIGRIFCIRVRSKNVLIELFPS